MSLNVRLLEKARELSGGVVQARCPACAENGRDRHGEHLRIYPDGRFGCCVFPKDREHRKRIFAIAGDKAPRSFTVKVASVPTAGSPTSVASSLTGFRGTLGTGKSESVLSAEQPSQEMKRSETTLTTLGTLGTPFLIPHAYAREKEHVMCDDMHTCKDPESGVPSVPESVRMPHFTPGGTLVIPFDSPERFHWWRGGQSVTETRAEVESWVLEGARKEHDGVGV